MFVDGENAELTPTEFRLLYQLALERGRVVTRDELLQKIWGRARRTGIVRSTFSFVACETRSTGGPRNTHSSRRATAWVTDWSLRQRTRHEPVSDRWSGRCSGLRRRAALAAAAEAEGRGRARRAAFVGAGSTFVPLVAKWIPDYSKKRDVTITYGPIGSGGGIEQVTNRTVTSVRATHPSLRTKRRLARAACKSPGPSAARRSRTTYPALRNT